MIRKAIALLCATSGYLLVLLVTGAPSQQQSQHPIPIAVSSATANKFKLDHGRTGIKVPGESPAYFCPDSDPADNIFNITNLDFLPTNPRVGFYQTIRFIGTFVSATGDVPWMTVDATYLDQDVAGNNNDNRFFYGPLCDIDVFQEIQVPIPDKLGGGTTPPEMFRSCPSGIKQGYAVITSWPIPLFPGYVPVGWYEARAEAITQDGRRIFCVEGTFEVTT